MENKKCKDLVQKKYEGTMKDLRDILDNDKEETRQEELDNFGLDISLIEAGTFEGQRADYVRYQLSWGGPADEFRIYKNGDVEYWYMDWYDGAKVDVIGEDSDLIKEIALIGFDDFLV